MKVIIFIGSRIHVFKEIEKLHLTVLKIYALWNSPLSNYLIENKIAHHSFKLDDKKLVLNDIYKQSFDILISNGCPYIFPVEKFKTHQTLLNIHPTYLPHLQGKTPLNGVFYLNYDFYGATLHVIDKGIDTGNIIYQEKHALTSDLDLGLIYYLSMKLEGDVFRKGWNNIVENDFFINGQKQIGTSSYFNRTDENRKLNFNEHRTRDIIRIVKSFGISSQGALCTILKKEYLFFKASEIINSELLRQFEDEASGSIVLKYDTCLLIKTIDSVVKIEKYKEL